MEPSVDTLGRWMAHHISELVIRCETEDGERKEAARRECFDAILALWRHRSELPNGKRPFEALEPIVSAVESLDPEDETPRYFRQARPLRVRGEEESEAESWLTLVDDLDYSAKLLIGYCLAQAANSVIDKSAEWVKHAEAAGLEKGPTEIVVKFVAPDNERNKEPDQNEKLRERLEERQDRLSRFVTMAEALADALKSQLNSLEERTEG